VAAEFADARPEARIDVVDDDEAWVSADRGLRYAVEHAVADAIEHNGRPDPEVTLRARSRAATAAAASRAVVEVADDGPTIPDVEVAAVATDEQVSETCHGTGVDMFVMKWCAESLGGSLAIRDNEPRGNVVGFTIPLLEATAEE
jgi:signal transduction histidine kinase